MNIFKRVLIVVLIIVIILLACWSFTNLKRNHNEEGLPSGEAKPSNEVQEDVLMNPEEQLNLIIDNYMIWKSQNEYENFAYAIMDLDFNGRLEIVSASFGGTGRYTYSKYYEVNEEYNGLNLCESNNEDFLSGADIITDEYPVFYDANSNTYHYILTDLIRISALNYVEDKRDFVLKDGRITETFLANRETTYDEKYETHDQYTLPSGEIISEEDYINMEDKIFQNLEKKYLNIEWLDQYEYDFNNMSDEKLLMLLKKSYETYGFKKVVGNQKELSENDRVRVKAYQKYLNDLLQEGILPNGMDAGYDDSAYYIRSGDQFAIGDIDYDGKLEMIISHVSTAVAGMMETIYEYDIDTHELKEELVSFPNLTYFDNGVIEAGWAHNQGKAGNHFWPYTLYQYHSQSDSYETIASVDAWDKSYTEEIYSEEEFPSKQDKDGDGMIYYIMSGDSFDYDNPVDLDEYDNWRNQYTEKATKVKILYQNLTEENINQLS